MLKFLLCHIHFIQSYYNNGAIFSVYWLGPQTKIFPSSWFCLKEALHPTSGGFKGAKATIAPGSALLVAEKGPPHLGTNSNQIMEKRLNTAIAFYLCL